MEGMTPLQVAEALNADADRTLEFVTELRPLQGSNKELGRTLVDCEALAHLGHYYADKILGASDLALFDQNGKSEQRTGAVGHMQAALDDWKKYAAASTGQYIPQKLGRVGAVDLNKLTARVEEDIIIAQNWKTGTIRGDGEVRRRDDNFQP